MHRQIVTVKNYNELCVRVAEETHAISQAAFAQYGRFTMALSGGSTPKGIHAAMVDKKFEWENIHFFLGDERWVPIDNNRSNAKMIDETLIQPGHIPADHFHPVETNTESPDSSAELYEKELSHFFNVKRPQFPQFDLILLGLGDDGHTASLFPGTIALNETKRWVVSNTAAGIPEPRVSFTYPMINNARNVFFIVSGKGKAAMMKKIFEENADVPAAKVNPANGTMKWFVDADAAGELHK